MTGDLDLPPAPPLPPDVRQRALRAVLQEMEDDADQAPPRRRQAPFLAAAAAVVTTLVVSSVVAIAGAVPQLRTATPPDADATLARCVAAVESGGWTAAYPPGREWRVTDVLADTPQQRVIAVNDRFACAASADRISLSTSAGSTSIDEAPSLVQLSATLAVVSNPQRDPISFTDAGGPQRTAAPVVLLRAAGPGSVPLDGVRTNDGGDRPISSATFGYYELVDRPARADGDPARVLSRCMDAVPLTEWWIFGGITKADSWKDSWVPAGDRPQRVGRTALMGSFCVLGPDGPVYAAGPVSPSSGVVASWRSADRTVVLMTDGGRPEARIEIRSPLVPGPPGIGSVCPLERGLALCDLPAADADVYIDGSVVPR